MGYQDDLKKHLADYKRLCLGIDDREYFSIADAMCRRITSFPLLKPPGICSKKLNRF